MRVPFLAAVASAACLLSACGFVAPAPPMPPDDNRVAINHGDPRLLADDRSSVSAQEVPQEDPVKVASAAPVSGILAGKSSAAPVPPPPSPAPAVPVHTPTTQPTVTQNPSIPVPPPPPKTDTRLLPVTAGAAKASSPENTPPAPVLVATANTVSTPVAQAELPEPKPPEPTQITPTALAPSPQAAPGAATGPIPVVDVAPESPKPAAEPVVHKEVWRITPEDGTVRQALVRWAAKANWTFGPDQWELPFDLPIQAPAEFEAASFQEATQALSQAIAMTESPIRPCFYGNRVLRMVSFNRSCNRAPAAQS